MKLCFTAAAWDDYLWFQEHDRKLLKRINLLLQAIMRSPFDAPMLVFLGIFLVWLGLEAPDRWQIAVPAICGGILIGGIGVWQAKHKVSAVLLAVMVAIIIYMTVGIYVLSFD